jgi:hypothetical protein
MPGAGCARGPRAKEVHGAVTTGSAGRHRHSLRNGFTAYYVLSPVNGVCCHRCRARTGGPDRRHGRGARTTRLCRPPWRFVR